MPRSDKVIDWTYNVLAAFEVTSPTSFEQDMDHKRNFYTRIESLTHYVVLAQDRREATVFARSNGFEPEVLNGAETSIVIKPLGVSIPLADICRDVPLD